jgi:hypothetical protein
MTSCLNWRWPADDQSTDAPQIRFEADLALEWRGNSHDPGRLEHSLTSAQRKTSINQVIGRTPKGRSSSAGLKRVRSMRFVGEADFRD